MNRIKGNQEDRGIIPVHSLPNATSSSVSLHIYRFKNEAIHENNLPITRPLPVTPLPTNLYHRHNYYEILFFEEGHGFHEIDFHTFPFQSPSIHFIAPGSVHLLSPSSDCRGYIIAFTEEHYNFHSTEGRLSLTSMPFFKKSDKLESTITLDLKNYQYLKNVINNMVEDLFDSPNQKEGLGNLYLQILLQKCVSISTRHLPPFSHQTSNSHIVGQFQELVEKHFRQHHEVKFYAEALAVSPDYLSKITRKYLETTASEYITTKILLEAKRLLVFSSLSSKEIAYHINIDDPSYFSRLFKRKTGLTPHEYRISVRKSTID